MIINYNCNRDYRGWVNVFTFIIKNEEEIVANFFKPWQEVYLKLYY